MTGETPRTTVDLNRVTCTKVRYSLTNPVFTGSPLQYPHGYTATEVFVPLTYIAA
jgi:hypothetical protein